MSPTSNAGAAIIGTIRLQGVVGILVAIALLYISGSIVSCVRNAYYGPLSKYPGPRLRALTVWPKVWSICLGREGADYPKLHAKYGPIVRIAPNELSFVGNAQLFKDVHGFKRMGERSPTKDPLLLGRPLHDVEHILMADDANHTRLRKILTHAFADRSLKDLEPMLKSWVSFMVEKLKECASSGEEADMVKFYNCATFGELTIQNYGIFLDHPTYQDTDIMADLCFNESLHMLENAEYSPWVKTIFQGVKVMTPMRALKYLGRPMVYLIDDVMNKHKLIQHKAYEHWRYCADRVDKRMSYTPKRVDLWTRILEKSKGPDALTLNEHYASAVIFMGAGTETTASALSGITYHLLQNPEMLAKLTHEIRTTFADLSAITLDGLQALEYLNAVINEGLRMYPPVAIALPRIVPPEGMTVGSERVPGGTMIGIHQLATYRSEDNFKNAYEFHPERWTGDDEYKGDNLTALEPFSVGPRNCLGKNLAWHEIRLILTATLLCFDLKLCKQSQNWTDQKIFLLWDKKPLMCTLSEAKTA